MSSTINPNIPVPGTSLDAVQIQQNFAAAANDVNTIETQLIPVTPTTQGFAPATGGGTANFLRADSTWAIPTGVGVGLSTNIFRPEDFGAKGDAFGAQDGVNLGSGHFSSASYFFSAKDVGKKWYQDFSNTYTIASVNVDGTCQITPTTFFGTTRITWIIGTDDTAALQACFDAAYNIIYNPGDESTALGLNGYVPSGGIIALTPGKAYAIFNSQASFNAGKLSCLTMHRRTTLTTSGSPNSQRAALIQLPASYGHAIENKSDTSFSDFLTIANITMYLYGDFSPNSLDGIHLQVPNPITFDALNAYNRFSNVTINHAQRYGALFGGNGELKVDGLDTINCQTGIYLNNQNDYELSNCRIGGSFKTGLYVYGSAGNITNCKIYFSGASGLAVDEDCAGVVLDGDPSTLSRQGLTFFTNTDIQESRGCSLIVKTGLCQFSGCQFTDAVRASISGGTLPTVLAGVYLKGNGARMNTFGDCYVGPAVAIFDNPNWSANTYSVYIDDVDGNGAGPQLNQGHIWTYRATTNLGGGSQVGTQYSGSGAVKGGGGFTNAKNTGLLVDTNGGGATIPTTPNILIGDNAGGVTTGAGIITSSSAKALAVGATGATNPALQVDASTASSVTGIIIKSAATGGATTLTAFDTATNGNLSISAQAGGNLLLTTTGFASFGGTSQMQTTSPQIKFTNSFRGFGAQTGFWYQSPASTNITASTNILTVDLDMSASIQHLTGGYALQQDMIVRTGKHSYVAASAITNAAGFTIDGPVIADSFATFTNSHGLYIPTKSVVANSGGTTIGVVTNSYCINVTAATGATNNYIASLNGTAGEVVNINTTGKITLLNTVTPIGTTGAVTINQPSGTVNIAAAGTSVVVTNSLVTANSIVVAVLRTNDTTAVLKNVVPAAGSFTITLNAAATATTSIGFIVIN